MDAALIHAFSEELIKISGMSSARDQELIDALTKSAPERTKIVFLPHTHPLMQGGVGVAMRESAYDTLKKYEKRFPDLLMGQERGKRHILLPKTEDILGEETALTLNGVKVPTSTQLAHEMGHVDDWDDKSLLSRARTAWFPAARHLESAGSFGSLMSGMIGGSAGKPASVALGLGVPMAMTAATGIPRVMGEAKATRHGLDRLEAVSTKEELETAEKALDAAGGTYRRGLVNDFGSHLALATSGALMGLGARYT
jgi:hypothetical protein